MKRPTWTFGTLIVCALAVAGCSTAHTTLPMAVQEQARVRNEGYSLLCQLLSQESGVADILKIKNADAPIAGLIKEIASVCGQAKKELELFRKGSRDLNWEVTNLPRIEQQTRTAIKSTVAKQLLFSSGKTFEARLLSTQAEAMNYAAHLAKVLHDQEDNPPRKEFLTTLSQRCTAFHDKAINLLK